MILLTETLALAIFGPAPLAMNGAIKKAEQIVAELGDKAYMLQQFNNPDNIKVTLTLVSH